MRLGKKKEKDMDNKCPRQTIDGICRLVCSYKTSQSPIKRMFIFFLIVSNVFH